MMIRASEPPMKKRRSSLLRTCGPDGIVISSIESPGQRFACLKVLASSDWLQMSYFGS
jgi:hypothetical protein